MADTIREIGDDDLIAELKRRASESGDLKQKALEALAGDETRPDVKQTLEGNGETASEEDVEKHELSSEEQAKLFSALEARFSEDMPYRPDTVKFADVRKALEARPDLLYSLNQMEKTGGQPDVIGVEGNTFVFADVSKESPEGRRNLDYDEAKAMADEIGVEMMDEIIYRKLQEQIPLDAETWSWLLTDAETRAHGNALRGYRVGVSVNVYEYWADSRSPDRGFRGLLRVPKL